MAAGLPERLKMEDHVMAITKQVKTGGLDMEWVELMKQAKEMGMSKEEVRHFLDERRVGRTNTYGT